MPRRFLYGRQNLAIGREKMTNAQSPINATLVQLIATPERFDGKLIRVIGFLTLAFEGDALYFHREDYEHAICGNGIWVEVTPEITEQAHTLNLNYVLLEGVFSLSNRGHMGCGAVALAKFAARWCGLRGHWRNRENKSPATKWLEFD